MQNPPEHRKTKEAFASEIVYPAMDPCANQRRIQKAGMVRGENHRAANGHSLRIADTPSKVECIKSPKKYPTQEINRIHCRTDSFRRHEKVMITSALVCAPEGLPG